MRTATVKCDECGESIGDTFDFDYSVFIGRNPDRSINIKVDIISTKGGKVDFCMACMKDMFNKENTKWSRYGEKYVGKDA